MRSFSFRGISYGGLFVLAFAGSACGVLSTGESGDGVTTGEVCVPSDEGGSAQVPSFPGSGMSGAGEPITAELDALSCGASRRGTPVEQTAEVDCYYADGDQSTPMAFIERVVEIVEGDELVHVRLTLNPAFVDNTYGETAIGWDGAGSPGPAEPKPGPAGPKPGPAGPKPKGPGGHTFKDLVGSDKAQFQMTDGTGELVLDFFVDYLSLDETKPSGYGSLGVLGGEGKMLLGDASAVVAATTSIDRDLNACGYGEYTVDSPATDEAYTPNAEAPGWDYRVVYDVWVSAAAFGAAGFGDATISYVHASPSKYSSSTLTVTPGPCRSTCEDDDPPAGGGGSGPGGDPSSGSGGDPSSGSGGDPGDGSTCQDTGGACESDTDCCAYDNVCLSGVCEQVDIPL